MNTVYTVFIIILGYAFDVVNNYDVDVLLLHIIFIDGILMSAFTAK